MLMHNGLEEGFDEIEEGYHRVNSESMASSRRTRTDTVSTIRCSSTIIDGAGIYVLPPIPNLGSIEEEKEWERATDVL